MEFTKLAMVGLAAGVIGGWLGIGGGALMVPVMILWLGIETKIAIATSLAAIVPIAISAATRHYTMGKVDLQLLAPLALGGLVGGVVGAWILDKTSAEWAKRALAIFLVYSAYRLWMSTVAKTS